jgi:hypothetical protein
MPSTHRFVAHCECSAHDAPSGRFIDGGAAAQSPSAQYALAQSTDMVQAAPLALRVVLAEPWHAPPPHTPLPQSALAVQAAPLGRPLPPGVDWHTPLAHAPLAHSDAFAHGRPLPRAAPLDVA